MSFMENGRCKVKIVYNDKTNLLYIRLDDKKQDVINRRVYEEKIIPIASKDAGNTLFDKKKST